MSVPEPDGAGVSFVTCTRNRSEMARAKAEWALADKHCREAVFVVDGTSDDTVERLAELARVDPRLRVIALKDNVGVPSARNIGVRAATSEWLVLIDDDDLVSDGFVEAVLRVARESGAAVVGTPWFNVTAGQDLDEYIAAVPRRPGGPQLDQPGCFPAQPWEDCLWSAANGLFRRDIFDELGYDPGYRVNFYREESDLMVTVARSGRRVVITSQAYTYLRERNSGGIERRNKLRYEYWVLRNNWRFLRKHGAWLRAKGHIARGPVAEQTGLAVRRLRPLARAAVRRLTGGRIAGATVTRESR